MAVHLLATKFTIPPPLPDHLSRARLLERLAEGLLPGRPLILVCAPAGYGKTTLVSEWASARGGVEAQFAWLSLEKADNDLARFFAYLAAALERAAPGTHALMEDLLAAPGPPAPHDLAAALVNPLAGCARPLVIVLDDYQAIHDLAIHTALEFLIDHLPSGVHLALATRSDPPLPLHRLRARGQLVELRMNDLRFERDETGQLLARSDETRLNEAEVGLLDALTEGWAAGLRMALLSIRGKDRPGEYLQRLSGRQRFILDYLAEEALHNQSEALQDFLLQTAVLERLCAPLCDAVTGQSNGQAMLEALEQANCFLIPLDDERTWYRYHHLFADLLRVRLQQRRPGLSQELHHRAAAWLEEHEASEEAVRHSIEAGDYERAARIVERSTLDLFARGQLHQLLAWIRLLPEALVARRPWLTIYQAWALAFAARLPEAEESLARVEASLAAGEFSPPEQARMQAEMRAIRSLSAASSGSIPAALALTRLPDEIVPPEAGFARSVQRWAVGFALRIQGDLDGAEGCFDEVLKIGYALDNVWTIVTASVDLGAVLRQRGELQRAEAVFRAGLARASQAAGGPGFVGRLESFLAYLLIEQGGLQEAGRLVEQAIAHNQSWQNPNHCAHGWVVKARLELLHNHPAAAEVALQEAEAWGVRGPIVPTLQALIEQTRVRLWLHTGALEKAAAWVEQHPFSPQMEGAPVSEFEEMLRLAAARVLLAAGRSEAIHALLAPVEAAARQRGRLSSLIETQAVRACAKPDPGAGAAILKEALALGLPRGFRQVFLDQGQPLIAILERCQEVPGVSDLLIALRSQEKQAPTGSPLTAREVEILRWVAAGLSNPEIGAKLYISPGTVKAHTAAIYRKLDAANRAEAIARAKDLGLL